MDRRFLLQLSVLGLLVVLPVTMIAINGIDAMHGILMPVGEQGDIAAGEREVTLVKASDGTGGEKRRFGVYDPSGVFAGESDLKIRHVYVSWVAFDSKELADTLTSLERQG